jgi:hypothetical protein
MHKSRKQHFTDAEKGFEPLFDKKTAKNQKNLEKICEMYCKNQK